MPYIHSLIALFCAFLYGASAVLCKVGLQRKLEQPVTSKLEKALGVMSNKVWVAGVALGIIANIIVVQVQSVIDISVVYPILSFAYIFTLVLGYIFLRERLDKNQWIGVAIVTFGTAIIFTIDDLATGQLTDFYYLNGLTAVFTVAVVALVFVATKVKGLNYEILYAVCAGVCFGNSGTFLKTSTNLITEKTGSFSIFSIHSITEFLYLWPFFALVFSWALGFVFLQMAYSRGNVSVTVPVVTVAERLIVMITGYLVFGEGFPSAKIVGFIAILIGVLIIIFSSLKQEQQTPALGKEYT